MCGDDKAGACGERRQRAGRSARHEEVGVDDIRAKAASFPDGGRGQARILGARAAAVVDDGTAELMALVLELVRDLLDERAEVGRGRARIHR